MAPAARLIVHDDAPAACAGAAADIAARVREALATRRAAHVAFSGGESAPLLFDALVREALDWTRVHVYQVDERVAPDGHDDRNATALEQSLVAPVALPADNVHLMPVTDADLDAAAERYAALVPAFDVVHLGMGADGHTASWPPGDPVVDVRDRAVAVVGPFNGRTRMTITPPVVEQAGAVVLLLYGATKREPLRRALDGDAALPAARIPWVRTAVHCDCSAAP